MENEFAILSQFLSQVGPEVSARSGLPVTDAQRQLIERFANGDLTSEEREQLLPDILENEKALRELVQAIQSQNK